MEPAGQQDHERLGLRVDPEARAREAGVAEAASGRTAPPRGRCKPVCDVPAQAPRCWSGGVAPGSIIGADGQRREHAAAVRPDAAVEQHLGEDRQVVGRARRAPRGRPRRPGPATAGRGPRRGGSARRASPARSARSARPGPARRLGSSIGRKSVSLMPRGPKISLAGEPVERLARDPLDELAEDQESDVAVPELLARRPDQAPARRAASRPSPGRRRSRPDGSSAISPERWRRSCSIGDRPLAVVVELGQQRGRAGRRAGACPARSGSSPTSRSRPAWSARPGRTPCRASSAPSRARRPGGPTRGRRRSTPAARPARRRRAPARSIARSIAPSIRRSRSGSMPSDAGSVAITPHAAAGTAASTTRIPAPMKPAPRRTAGASEVR